MSRVFYYPLLFTAHEGTMFNTLFEHYLCDMPTLRLPCKEARPSAEIRTQGGYSSGRTLTPPDLKIIIKKYRKLFKTTQNRGISNFLYVHWYKLFSWVI